MSDVHIVGTGAVSPAGWGVAALREAVAAGRPLPVQAEPRPGWSAPLRVRRVPSPVPQCEWAAHPRLRRASPISQFAVAAACEAVGEDAGAVRAGAVRLGVILCTLVGSVVYSRRFYHEAWHDPATASPLLFPETVFNAPASHIAAVLGTTAVNYTFVGDQGAFAHGLGVAAAWLEAGEVESCVVVGAEETDWLVSDAQRHFSRRAVASEGAGALYLKRATAAPQAAVALAHITEAWGYGRTRGRLEAARRMRAELAAGGGADWLADGLQDAPRTDAAEAEAWRDWSGARVSPRVWLGDGLVAGAAWQCVLGVEAVRREGRAAAWVSLVGVNQQAIGVRFARSRRPTIGATCA